MIADHVMNLLAFACKMGVYFVHGPDGGRAIVKRLIIEQIYSTGVRTLALLVPIAIIVGTMLIIQFAKFSGQYDPGKITVLLIVREICPFLIAILVILRSAIEITIEVSYMNIFHEIDALEMTGIDPMWVICFPRLIGITSAMLSLSVIFDILSILGGYTIAWSITYIPLGNYMEQIGKALSASDILVGIIKIVFFGAIISVTALYYGFKEKHRISEIPSCTSRAALECFFYCIVMNVFVSVIFYL